MNEINYVSKLEILRLLFRSLRWLIYLSTLVAHHACLLLSGDAMSPVHFYSQVQYIADVIGSSRNRVQFLYWSHRSAHPPTTAVYKPSSLLNKHPVSANMRFNPRTVSTCVHFPAPLRHLFKTATPAASWPRPLGRFQQPRTASSAQLPWQRGFV